MKKPPYTLPIASLPNDLVVPGPKAMTKEELEAQKQQTEIGLNFPTNTDGGGSGVYVDNHPITIDYHSPTMGRIANLDPEIKLAEQKETKPKRMRYIGGESEYCSPKIHLTIGKVYEVEGPEEDGDFTVYVDSAIGGDICAEHELFEPVD